MNTQKGWFSLAGEDLAVAEHTAKTMYPVPAAAVCFHCQQAAEKYLKGYLAPKLTDEPPYTHDLRELNKMCEQHDAGFNALGTACAILTLFAVKTRYDQGQYPTEDDMNAALAYARQVRDFVLSLGERNGT